MSLTLLDWRRRVSTLYADIRNMSDMPAAHRLWQTTRDALFREHPDSPLTPGAKANFPGPAGPGHHEQGLPVAPYDPWLRFEVPLDTDVEPERIQIPTGTDGTVTFERIGRVRLAALGRLDVWWLQSYGGGIWLPVKDALAGAATYGGGRYVLDTVKGADLGGGDGWLVVDLNFAYNPSCAYDPAWACPLAPPGNCLDQPVLAGELME